MSNTDILEGEHLFRQRARLTLPYLVRQAKAAQPIFYSDLAKLIKISNPRNFNHILGAIGDGLMELSKRTETDIPPITCLVLNKQTNLPSEGIGYAIDTKKFKRLPKNKQQNFLKDVLLDIFSFGHWDWVLKELNLKAIKTDLTTELGLAKHMKGGGESPYHKAFKKFISENPAAVKLSKHLSKGQIEYPLPSADCIDVLFKDGETMIGVEVKSKVSSKADILRGLFQCIKYKFLLGAEQVIKEKKPDSRAILALEGKLPSDLLIIKNLLDVEVVDNIKNRS